MVLDLGSKSCHHVCSKLLLRSTMRLQFGELLPNVFARFKDLFLRCQIVGWEKKNAAMLKPWRALNELYAHARQDGCSALDSLKQKGVGNFPRATIQLNYQMHDIRQACGASTNPCPVYMAADHTLGDAHKQKRMQEAKRHRSWK
jgi:hypothetical protein